MTDSAAEARLDRTLVARAVADGDRGAFEQLLRRHQGMVRAQLRRLLQGNDALADDLAQETFLTAWRKLDQFRGDARFSTWLYRIAYTCFIDTVRRSPALPCEPMEQDLERLPAPPQHVDLRLDVERAMRKLSDAEQAVLLHCVQLGLSHDEAAYVLAMPLGTVKTHALRGKAKLRAWLAAWNEAGTEEQT
ncbi:RNA polymerase sigma factor [Paucibacter sp. R3-3]|uniref:RNA polymerase sigma factor n=1 Tax=Roseateles agri TaxID=3098619 RepID=A0ABU5DQ46_9BURK|nr:RNA polymerase sigma factor [Paucibacter sp. R3-3]MDY0748450.1 RNA polymerase sigma factor [Paucibacter sp. R3-3]